MISVTRDKRNIAPLSGGEANTASNVGSAGVGTFKQKSGIDLEHYKILASEGVSLVLDGTDKLDSKLAFPGLTTATPVDTTADVIAYYLNGSGVHRKCVVQLFWNKALQYYLTTAGDVLYMGSVGVPQRLAIGTAGQFLRVNSGATAPAWDTIQDCCHWQIPEPTADDDGLIARGFPQAATIKSVIHQVSGGTNVVFNLDIRDSPFDGSPTAVWSADKTATTSEQTESSFDNAAIAAHDFLAIKVTSVSGSVDDFIVAVEYELDA